MYRHQAASAINPAPSGAISYRSRHSRHSRPLAKWRVKITEDFQAASVFLEIFVSLSDGGKSRARATQYSASNLTLSLGQKLNHAGGQQPRRTRVASPGHCRKVGFGSQSEQRAQTHEILMSVPHTLRKRTENVFGVF
jgi:hypothetical protein